MLMRRYKSLYYKRFLLPLLETPKSKSLERSTITYTCRRKLKTNLISRVISRIMPEDFWSLGVTLVQVTAKHVLENQFRCSHLVSQKTWILNIWDCRKLFTIMSSLCLVQYINLCYWKQKQQWYMYWMNSTRLLLFQYSGPIFGNYKTKSRAIIHWTFVYKIKLY